MPVMSYVLRIYCENHETENLPPLIGLIEDATGSERSFHSLEELGLILRDITKRRTNARQDSK